MIGKGRSSRQMVRCWLDGLGAGNETRGTYEDSVVLGDNDIRVMNLRGVVANVRLLNLIMPFWKSRINDSSYSGPFLLLPSTMRAIKGQYSPHSVPNINSPHVSHNGIGVLLVWFVIPFCGVATSD